MRAFVSMFSGSRPMGEDAALVVHRLDRGGVVERVLGGGVVWPGAQASGRIPIDSYQDALLDVVGDVDRDACRPASRLIRQSRGVAFIATSQLTAPAGS